MKKVLIVAKCNVNLARGALQTMQTNVLIVAKCNVNVGQIKDMVDIYPVLIVAKCNVNRFNDDILVRKAYSINSSKV